MNQIYLIIEQYLKNQLDKDEKIAFERMMADDADFAALVQQHRIEHDALELLVEQDLRNSMKKWSSEVPQESESSLTIVHRKNPYRMVLPLAAASFTALFCLWFFTQNDKNIQNNLAQTTQNIENNIPTPTTNEAQTPILEPSTSQKINMETKAPAEKRQEHFDIWKEEKVNTLAIAEDYYGDGPTMNVSQMRSANTSNEELENIFNLYQAKKYNEALSKIKEFSSKNYITIQTEWLKANAFFQLKNYNEALVSFQFISKNKNNPLTESAEYYTILCKMAVNYSQKMDFQQDIDYILKDSEHGFYEKTLKINQMLKH